MKLSFHGAMPPSEIGEAVSEQFKAGVDSIHAEGLSFHHLEAAPRAAYISEIASAIGAVTLTGGKQGTEVWELNSATSPNATFVPFHTDNPYLGEPEEIVSFWNVRSSELGGENLILPVNALTDALDSRSEYRELLDELMHIQASFVHGDKTAIGPILDTSQSRVRYDQKYISPVHAELGARLSKALHALGRIAQPVKLNAGDALFFNNQTVLHARAPYSDPSRLSLRVRIQSPQSAQP